MTQQPYAPPAFPALTDSILGPLLIGLATTAYETGVLDDVWHAAAESVPLTLPVLKVGAGKAAQPLKHRRSVLTGTSSGYPKLARLCDARGNEAAAESWQRWRWAVGARIVPDNATRQLVGADRTPIRVDVICYRIRVGKVQDAQQLALFRHYLVTGFQALDPSVLVAGGQHGWQDNWWQVAQN